MQSNGFSWLIIVNRGKARQVTWIKKLEVSDILKSQDLKIFLFQYENFKLTQIFMSPFLMKSGKTQVFDRFWGSTRGNFIIPHPDCDTETERQNLRFFIGFGGPREETTCIIPHLDCDTELSFLVEGPPHLVTSY